MRSFRDLPLRTKLRILLVGIVGITLLLSCGFFVANDVHLIKSSMSDQVSVLADMLSANSAAALTFDDVASAEQVLSSLKLQPSVVFACTYDAKGKVFASYAAEESERLAPLARVRSDVPFFEGGYLHVFKAVVQDQKPLGTIYLRASMSGLDAQLRHYIAVALAVVAASMGAAIFLVARLQQVVTGPVLRLADATRRVAAESDFSIRVRKEGEDELGVLCDAFNSMLTQIQQRDAELEEHRLHLEQLVQQRTRSLEGKTLALRESEERLNLALKSSGVGTWSWDMLADTILWDDYIHPLFGLPADALPGKFEDFLARVHADDRQRVKRDVRTAVEEHPHCDTEFQVQWPDESLHDLAFRGKVYRDELGRPVRMAGVLWEITERKRAERAVKLQAQQLERLNTELQRSNVELEQFASIASHDLQEPLRKVQAFGDMLTTKYLELLGEEGRDYIRRMQNAAGRMKTLINDLLTYSRVTSKAQPFAPVDLGAVAAEVASDLETRLQETGGHVEFGPLPTLEADPTQMRQLLQNLIGNSLKYHRADTPPRVQLHSRLLDNTQGAALPGAAATQVCELIVQDNGIGFDEKYVDRIFAPFVRLHGREEYEGTGMGLAVCNKIVRRHGGTIAAHGTPGVGATFRILLPLEQARHAGPDD